MRNRLPFLLAIASLAAPCAARAQSPARTLQLVLHAPPRCPSAQQIEQRIARQLADDGPLARDARVQITIDRPERGAWRASVRSNDDSDAREVLADNCDRAASAAAVVASVMIRADEAAPVAPSPSTIAPVATPAALTPPTAPAWMAQPFTITRRLPPSTRVAIFESSMAEEEERWRNGRTASLAGNVATASSFFVASATFFAVPNALADWRGIAVASTVGGIGVVMLATSLIAHFATAYSPYMPVAGVLHDGISRGDGSERSLERAQLAWRALAARYRDMRTRFGVFEICSGAILIAGAAGFTLVRASDPATAWNASIDWLPPLVSITAGGILLGSGVAVLLSQTDIERSFEGYSRRVRNSIWPMLIPMSAGGVAGLSGTY